MYCHGDVLATFTQEFTHWRSNTNLAPILLLLPTSERRRPRKNRARNCESLRHNTSRINRKASALLQLKGFSRRQVPLVSMVACFKGPVGVFISLLEKPPQVQCVCVRVHPHTHTHTHPITQAVVMQWLGIKELCVLVLPALLLQSNCRIASVLYSRPPSALCCWPIDFTCSFSS